jgi:hypothetical protein
MRGRNDANNTSRAVAMRRRHPRQRVLRDISRELAVSDARLDELFLFFNQRFRGEEMPRAETIRTGPLGWIIWFGRWARPTSADFPSQVAWHL